MSDEQRDNDKRVFPPPDVPVKCSCLHCGRIYTSDMLIEVEIDGEYHYACPVKGCDAMGWNFDIFSTEPGDEEDGGWVDDDYEEDEFENEFDEAFEGASETVVNESGPTFDPPRQWTPESDLDDADEEFDEEFEEGEDANRGTVFTREEYEQLKSAGEYDRKIEEIRQHWRSTREDRPPRDSSNPVTDDDIPF
jgi:hypothetical protein